jgi:hypothetical protein
MSKHSLLGPRRIRLLHLASLRRYGSEKAATHWLFRRRVNPRRHLIMRLVRGCQTSVVLSFEQERVWEEWVERSCAVYLVDLLGR